MFEMYKKAVASFWTTDEVDLSQDMRDWERLTGGCPASDMGLLEACTGCPQDNVKRAHLQLLTAAMARCSRGPNALMQLH